MIRVQEWPSEFAAAAALLMKAVGHADARGRPRWDFAVEIADLKDLGLSTTDLRALVCDRLVEHSADITRDPSTRRIFQPTGKLTFDHRTCFILTEAGFSAASRVVANGSHRTELGPPPEAGTRPAGVQGLLLPQSFDPKPAWNPVLRRLLWGSLLVKEFRANAPNQQLILTSFQEEGWPPRIDDPLPPAPDIDPKRRLHETIASLNRKQVNQVIRFAGDGFGRGICWLPRAADWESHVARGQHAINCSKGK